MGSSGDDLGLGRHGLDLDVAGLDSLVGLDRKALADEGGGHGSHLCFGAVRTVRRGRWPMTYRKSPFGHVFSIRWRFPRL